MSGALPSDRAVAVPAEPEVSALRASIPSALCGAVAAEFDPYIAKLIDRRFTGGLLGRIIEWEDTVRGAAVAAVDSYHGFTCEFSPWPKQHASEYDTLEELLTCAISREIPEDSCWSPEFAQAIEARRAETGTGSVHESAVAEGDAP